MAAITVDGKRLSRYSKERLMKMVVAVDRRLAVAAVREAAISDALARERLARDAATRDLNAANDLAASRLQMLTAAVDAAARFRRRTYTIAALAAIVIAGGALWLS